ncbi:MAG: SCP2 sterol-binding domain-containing protein [Phycisphaerales bacterium]|nr:SCP2 sterol-binding domain-containing protein [Phycisphaerales bacterium]
MSFKVSSVQEYFETLDKRFNAGAAAKVDAVYQFELGEDGTYHVEVHSGACEVVEGAHDDPTTRIVMSGPNFVKMTNGELNGQMAYMSGKMKIKGSIPMAMKMKELFPQAG